MQYNNLFALFDNWDLYTKELNTSQNALGTLQKQQDTYMESTAAHLAQLKANAEDVYDSIFNSEGFKVIVDFLSSIVGGFADAIDSIGGTGTALVGLGSIASKILGEKISGYLTNIIVNSKNAAENFNKIQAQISITSLVKDANINDPIIKELVNYKEKILDLKNVVTEEENNAFNGLLKQYKEMQEIEEEYKVLLDKSAEYASQVQYGSSSKVKIETDKEGNIKNKDAIKQLSKNMANWHAVTGNISDKLIEIISSTEEEAEVVKDVNYLREKAFKNLKQTEEQENKIFTLERLRNGLSKEDKKTLNESLEELENQESTYEQIEEAIKNISILLQKVAKKGKEVSENLDNPQLKNLSSAAKAEIENIIDEKALQQKIYRVTQLTSVIGQLSFSIMSIQNLGSIWKNEDLTTGEKVLQIVMNLSMVIGQLASSYSALKELDLFKSFKNNKTTSPETASDSISAANTAAKEVETKAIEENTVAQEANNAAKKESKTAEAASSIVTEENTAAQEANTEATAAGTVAEKTKAGVEKKNIATKEAETGAIEKNTAAQEANNAAKKAASFIASPEGWIMIAIAVIGTATAAINAYSKGIEEAAKKKYEENQQDLENLKTLKEEIQKRKEAYKSISDLNEKYKNGEVTKTELIAQTKDLCEQYDIENTRILNLIGNYKDLKDLMQDLKKTNIDKSLNTLTNQKEVALRSIELGLKQNTGGTFASGNILNKEGFELKQSLGNFLNPFARVGMNKIGTITQSMGLKTTDANLSSFLLEGIPGAMLPNTSGVLFSSKEKEGSLKYYQEILKQEENLYNKILASNNSIIIENQFTKELEDNINILKENIQEYQNAAEEFKQEEIEYAVSNINFDDISNFKDLENAKAQIKNNLKDLEEFKDLSETEWEALINSALAANAPDKVQPLVQKALQKSSTLQTLTDNYQALSANTQASLWEKIGKGQISQKDWDENYQTILANVSNIIEELDLSAIWNKVNLKSLTEEDWEKVLNPETAKTAIIDIIQEQGNDIIEAFARDDASTITTALRTLKEGLADKSLTASNIADNEAFKSVKNYLEELKTLYPDLTAEVSLLNNAQLAGTTEYQKALEKIENKISKVDLAYKIKEASIAIEEFQKQYTKLENGQAKLWIDADTSEFSDKLAEILNQDYSIAVEIQAEVSNQFNSLTSKIQNIRDAISAIGEDYQISADNILKVSEAFPGILENYKILENGTVQLDKSMMVSASERAKQEILNSKNSTVAQLKNEKDLVDTKIKGYEIVLQGSELALSNIENGNETSSKAIALINEGLNTIISSNNDISAQNFIENEISKEESSEESSEKVASKWTDAALQMDAAFANALQNMKANEEKFANGEEIQKLSVSDILKDVLTTTNQEQNESVEKAMKSGRQDAEFEDELAVNYIKKNGVWYNKNGTVVSQEDIDKERKAFYQSRVQTTTDTSKKDSASSKLQGDQDLANKYLNKYNDADSLKAVNEQLKAYIEALKIQSQDIASRINAAEAYAQAMVYGMSNAQEGNLSYIPENLTEYQREFIKTLSDSIKTLESEIDIYQKVEQESKFLAESFENLKNEADMLVGAKLTKNLQEQLESLDKQIENLNERQAINKQKYDNSMKTLSGYGITFDKEGHMENYEEVFKRIESAYIEADKEYQDAKKKAEEKKQQVTIKKDDQLEAIQNEKNAIITEKNNATAAEREMKDREWQLREKELEKRTTDINNAAQKEQNLIEEEVNVAQKKLNEEKLFQDQFNTDLGYLEDVTKDILSTRNEIEEKIRQQIEIKIELFDQKLKITLDLREAQRQWEEFKSKVINKVNKYEAKGLVNTIKESTLALAEYDTYYNKLQNGTVQALNSQISSLFIEAQKMSQGLDSAFSKDGVQDWAAVKERMEDYFSSLMSAIEEADEKVEESYENYLSAIDDVKEAFDDHIAQYEYLNKLTEHGKNLVSLLYGDTAYSEMEKYQDMQKENNLELMDFYQQEMAFWKEKLSTVEEGSEEWIKYRKNYESAQDSMLSSLEDALENIADSYENHINSIFDPVLENIDQAQDEWDTQMSHYDKYYDTVNAAYQLSALQSKYVDAINDSDSTKTQKELTNLMNNQLQSLKEKEELSKYDVERANKIYEIAVKKAELEEAKSSKTNMRLTRDAQGNYTYKQVADQDSISSLQEEIDKLNNELYNIDLDAYQEQTQELINLKKEYVSELKQIYLENYQDEETLQKKILALNEKYDSLGLDSAQILTTAKENLEYDFIDVMKMSSDEIANYVATKTGQTEDEFRDLLNQSKGFIESGKEAFSLGVDSSTNAIDAFGNNMTNNILPTITGTWGTSCDEMADKFCNGSSGFTDICEKGLKGLSTATYEYQGDLSDLEDAAGISFGNIDDYISDSIDYTENLMQDNDDVIKQYDELLTSTQKLYEEMKNNAEAFDSARSSAIQQVAALKEMLEIMQDLSGSEVKYSSGTNYAQEIKDLIDKGYSWDSQDVQDLISLRYQKIVGDEMSDEESGVNTDWGQEIASHASDTQKNGLQKVYSSDFVDSFNSAISKLISGDYSSVSKDTSVSSTVSTADKLSTYVSRGTKTQTAESGESTSKTLEDGKTYYTTSSFVSNLNGIQSLLDKKGYSETVSSIYNNKVKLKSGKSITIKSGSSLPQLNTGGYTGDWSGEDGKLAVLHSKELVLNKEDTSNMLQAVDIVRQIASTLSSLDGSSLSNLLESYQPKVNIPQFDNDQTIEQQIHMEVSFPNATDKNEIQEAILGLSNKVSQYIGKKNK